MSTPVPSSSPVSPGDDENKIAKAIGDARRAVQSLALHLPADVFEHAEHCIVVALQAEAREIDRLRSALSTATARAERAEEDSKRLDWLNKHAVDWLPDLGATGGDYAGFNDEIDAALVEAKGDLRAAVDAMTTSRAGGAR